jgi:hypothetical protein
MDDKDVPDRDKPKNNPKKVKPVIYPTWGCPAGPPPDPVPDDKHKK